MPARRTIAGVLAGALVAVSIALGAGTGYSAGRTAVPDEPQPVAFLVADADTGAIIATRNEHQALPPASTMKLVTALVGLEQLPLDTTLDVSALAADQPAMKINMHEGERWPMTDALHAMLMASANDAAYAIAENASGGIEQFAADMQAAGKRWGLRDSALNDPAGLDAEGEGFRDGSLMSAYDLAVVGRNALAVPAIADTVKLPEYRFTDPTGLPRSVPNHNDTWLASYEGATGLKPGFTEKANRTLVASATRGGRTCVAVVLGIYDVDGWAARLNDQCFATPVVAQNGAKHLPSVRVATVDARRDAVAGFPRALGAPALGAAADPGAPSGGTRTAPAPNEVADRRVERSTDSNDRQAAERAAAAVSADSMSADSGGSSRLTLRNLILVAVVLLIVVVLLRRRAVKRQRQRRAARQRMLADARRRGVLHVLDPESTGEVSHVSVVPRHSRRAERSRS